MGGFVVLRSVHGLEVSFTSPFLSPGLGQSQLFVVHLDALHGWRREPGGQAANREDLEAVLSQNPTLLIRGDMWVYGSTGYGQEVVYLTSAQLYGALST